MRRLSMRGLSLYNKWFSIEIIVLIKFFCKYFLPVLISLFNCISAKANPYEIAILQGLDKVTARVLTIEAPVGETVSFGALEIIVRSCDKRPPEETPESAIFVDIWEVFHGEPAQSLFRGWMFGSSPALSAMEHPVYDVWVLDCKKAELKN